MFIGAAKTRGEDAGRRRGGGTYLGAAKTSGQFGLCGRGGGDPALGAFSGLLHADHQFLERSGPVLGALPAAEPEPGKLSPHLASGELWPLDRQFGLHRGGVGDRCHAGGVAGVLRAGAGAFCRARAPC